jgi:FkbM family methyltransferase
MRVADVGANAGSLTRRFLEQGAVVTAIEPHPEMAAKLRETYPSVTVIEAAASDQIGTATLYHSRDSQQSSLFRPAILAWVAESTVPTVTLDSLGVFDVVKIDAQGAEAKILHGARRTLEARQAIWFVEVWNAGLAWAGTSVEAVLEPFIAHGYVSLGRTWDEAQHDALEQRGHGAIDVLVVPAGHA